jgi:Uncharacterized proteins, homologs of microcin C7 resistance protein MccF
MTSPAQVERIKPPALRVGDNIGIVAPASYFKREDFEAGCAALRKMGYNPVFEESIFDRDLYFAGALSRRARELEDMFVRDDVKAIVCARGGYGSNYFCPHSISARSVRIQRHSSDIATTHHCRLIFAMQPTW